MAKGKGRKKERRNVPTGVAHIQSTFNITIVTITDPQGNVLAWSSAGATGLKGSRKGTPFAAGLAAEAAARKAIEHGGIGRGSWRGRGEISVGAGSFKKKKKNVRESGDATWSNSGIAEVDTLEG